MHERSCVCGNHDKYRVGRADQDLLYCIRKVISQIWDEILEETLNMNKESGLSTIDGRGGGIVMETPL